MQHGPTPPQPVPTTTTTQADRASTSTDTNEQPVEEAQLTDDQPDQTSESTASNTNALFQILGGENQDSILPGLLFMLGVIIALFIVMRGLRRNTAHTKAQTRAMSDPAERIDTLRTNAARSMEPAQRAYVELEDVARRLSASLDNKATRLELLLEQATERIESLERTIAQRDQSTPKPREVTPEALDRARVEQDREERAAAPKEPKPRSAIDELADKVEHADDPQPIAFQSPYAGPPLQDRVRELHTQGLSAAEIASRLDKPIGQIELILNLWRNSG
jgi:hypothetical protein